MAAAFAIRAIKGKDIHPAAHAMRAVNGSLPCPLDLSELATLWSDIDIAKLDDLDPGTLDSRSERNRSARKVDVFDDPKAKTATTGVGDPGEQIAFEATRQERAFWRRRNRGTDDQNPLRASFSMNRSFKLDRRPGKQQSTLENQGREW